MAATDADSLIARRCTTCHSVAPIYRSAGSASDWHDLVHRMAYHHKGKLLTHITDAEADAIARYLAEIRPPDDAASIRIGHVPTGRPL
jgi:hypothetical protein